MSRTETIGCNGKWCIAYTRHIDEVTWEDAYTFGYRQPNYPVPAIPMDVGIHSTFVDICEYRKDRRWHKTIEWLK